MNGLLNGGRNPQAVDLIKELKSMLKNHFNPETKSLTDEMINTLTDLEQHQVGYQASMKKIRQACLTRYDYEKRIAFQKAAQI